MERHLPTPASSSASVRDFLGQPEERARLLRFCERLAGDHELAEDLAQETLLQAWKSAPALRNENAWRSWLCGIARNLHLRWCRQQGRDPARRAPAGLALSDGPLSAEAQPDSGADLQEALEQGEIADLLGRALDVLPPETRQILIEHYVDDVPQTEIAARKRLSEKTLAVRLHRAKNALRRELPTRLRTEAASYGLISADAALWQQTRIWCPFCGRALLRGRGAASGRDFQIDCPACGHVAGPRVIDYPSDCIFAHQALDTARILESVAGFKPSLNRLIAYWREFIHEGQRRGQVNCLGCGQALRLRPECPSHLTCYPWRGLHIHCERCRKIHVLVPGAFTLCAPEVQPFWRRHPRIRMLPSRLLPGAVGGAFLVTVESVNDSARLDLIFSGTDHTVLEAHAYTSVK